jgi:GTP-binding protein
MPARGELTFLVVDTGGVEDFLSPTGELEVKVARQVETAIQEADLVLFLVEADGLTAQDEEISQVLRALGKPVILVVNKIDRSETQSTEFWRLGFEVVPISAAQAKLEGLLDRIAYHLLPIPSGDEKLCEGDQIKVAVMGRPNVGKSTLINRLVGEERVISSSLPGTTRDTIEVPFEHAGQSFLLIDTAGIRRKSRIEEEVEKFSVLLAFEALHKSHVVIYLIDAKEGVTSQDARLIGRIYEEGYALVIGLNKWDGLAVEQKRRVKAQLETDLQFCTAPKIPISALHGTGVGNLIDKVLEVYFDAGREFSTSWLTRILHEAQNKTPPPMRHGRRIRLKFAHQAGKYPLQIAIYGTQIEHLPPSYKRFLSHYFQESLKITVPIRLKFMGGENPFSK